VDLPGSRDAAELDDLAAGGAAHEGQ
jgi:hypothetical protein